MTNAEKRKDEIIAQECKTGDWAIDINTDKIVCCETLSCSKCLFNNADSCTIEKVRWLNSEYKEPKEFTDEERKFMELLDKAEWVARDIDEVLCVYIDKPHRGVDGFWHANSNAIYINDLTSLPFAAIKSTDTEPTSRAEILGEK